MKGCVKLSVLMVFIAAVGLSSCSKGEKDADDWAGTQETFTFEGVAFNMVYVPDSVSCNSGTDDQGGIISISDAYYLAETEMTYELGSKVLEWATISTPSPRDITLSREASIRALRY
jgi:hypothetical protein